MPRRRFLLLLLLPALVLLVFAVVAAEQAIEAGAAARLRRAGLSAREVRFSWVGPLSLTEVTRALPGGGQLRVQSVRLRWRLLGGLDARTHVAAVALRGLEVERGALRVAWTAADLKVAGWTRAGGGEQITLQQADGGTVELATPPAGAAGTLVLDQLDLSTAEVAWNGSPFLSPGRWSGRATLTAAAPAFASEGTFHGDALRFTVPAALQIDARARAPTQSDLEWWDRR
jgi:hypothetical protein